MDDRPELKAIRRIVYPPDSDDDRSSLGTDDERSPLIRGPKKRYLTKNRNYIVTKENDHGVGTSENKKPGLNSDAHVFLRLNF